MSKCTTGELTECRIQPIEFWEYIECPEPRKAAISSSSLDPYLPSIYSRPFNAKSVQLVDKKWIYLFIKVGESFKLNQEGYVYLQGTSGATCDQPEKTILGTKSRSRQAIFSNFHTKPNHRRFAKLQKTHNM